MQDNSSLYELQLLQFLSPTRYDKIYFYLKSLRTQIININCDGYYVT